VSGRACASGRHLLAFYPTIGLGRRQDNTCGSILEFLHFGCGTFLTCGGKSGTVTPAPDSPPLETRRRGYCPRLPPPDFPLFERATDEKGRDRCGTLN
jgi:hypothetical protein